jgi:tetratricopeptide (TPR) repeat protein
MGRSLLTSRTDRMSVEAIEAFNAGVTAMCDGDEPAAIYEWQRAVSLYPNMLPATRNLIVYHEGRGEYDRVAELYGALLSYDPFDTHALVRQATAFRNLARLPEAAANYERAIAIYPHYRFWYEELAELLITDGREQDAATWRERAGAINCDEAELAFEDGIRQFRSGNDELSAAIFDAVLEEVPDNLEARIYLARAKARAGDEDGAISELTNAVDVTQTAKALPLVHRARLHRARSHDAEAVTDLEEALELHPGYGRAEAMLAGLQAAHPAHSSTNQSLGGAPPTEQPTREQSATAAHQRAGQSSRDVATASRTPHRYERLNRDQPWISQVAQVVRQTLKARPAGAVEPTVALLFEPAPALAGPSRDMLALLTSEEFNLYGTGRERLYAVQAQGEFGADVSGVHWAGWVTPSTIGYVASSSWVDNTNGMTIDRMLETVGRAGGERGFDLVLMVGSGRIRHDQTQTETVLKAVNAGRMGLVVPGVGAADISTRMRSIVPHWVEVHLPS